LNQHHFLRHIGTLIDGAKTNHVSDSWISLRVSMGNAHAPSNGDVKSSEFTVFVNDSDESKVICENVDIVSGRYGDSDFELD
jgi:hypothetical protein